MPALNWKPFIYGGLASITAECGTFPIDLTKTRLQVQGQVNDAKYKEIRYRGMVHALVRICREEGLKALYSGIAPAMLRQASYGTIKIGTYQSLKRMFHCKSAAKIFVCEIDETLMMNVVCGVLSGVISSSIANPTDVLKIRMQAQGRMIQGGMMSNFIQIYQKEGTKGLWKAMSLTAQRAAIVVGVELPVYDLTKKHIIMSGYMGDTVYTHFLSSFLCGLAGALASNPVDVVRTRMMNQKSQQHGGHSAYKGTLDCL
ncbi:KMCP1 protein, partial [Chloropsis cyanopogon]|nr:KMCP1 protein [Chloropsis cyanopogon]